MRKMILGTAMATAMHMTMTPAIAAEPNQLADERVRQAIAYAIDMDTIVETLLEGKALVADSMIPNGDFKAEGLDAYSYDPEKARALLADAGWDDSQVLDVVYYYGDQLTVDLMVALQAYLADVGVQMTYRKIEGDVAGQLNTVPEDGSDTSAVEWDITYGARAALVLQEYYNVLKTGESSYAPGTPERDALIERINGSVDIEEQKAAFKDFERYENTALAEIPLYYQQLFIYESNRMSRNGEAYGNDQFNYDWGIVNWTVEPDENGKKVLYTNTGPMQFFEHPWLNPGLYVQSKVAFDQLLTSNGNLVPTEGQLAESFEVAEDGMSVTFNLKDDLSWHDGAPLSGEDVKWSIETALKVLPPISSVFTNTFNSIEGAASYMDGSAEEVSGIVVDGDVVTITFGTLDPSFLTTFSQFPPLPKHLMGDVNPTEFQQHPFWQFPIGSGPFKLAEVEMNDFVRFVPFEDYHGGVAKVDELVAYPSEDNDANVIKNAAGGRLDFGFTKSVADVQALEEMDHMKVTPVDIPYTRALRVNHYPNKPE